MNLPALKTMTADEFVLWAERQERGRYELVDGIVVAEMNAERLTHVRVKANIYVALRAAIRNARLQAEVFPDGMAMKVAERVVHEPDAMLRLGSPLPGDVTLVTDPVVVVEVLSPSTGPVDTGVKLVNYFKVASVEHYLVVNTIDGVVMHYRRGVDRDPVMSLVRASTVVFDPPGLTIAMAEIFE